MLRDESMIPSTVLLVLPPHLLDSIHRINEAKYPKGGNALHDDLHLLGKDY